MIKKYASDDEAVGVPGIEPGVSASRTLHVSDTLHPDTSSIIPRFRRLVLAGASHLNEVLFYCVLFSLPFRSKQTSSFFFSLGCI